jgi:5-formyltetrahydrofolate cyclo-ligase
VQEKFAARAEMRRALEALGPRARAMEEELVSAAIQADPAWSAAQVVLGYRNVRHEFGVVGALNGAFRDGKRVAFPRVEGKGLVLHTVRSWDGLRPGAFGIPEPAPSAPVVQPDEVEVALVPGLAFDRDGYRLGQGGGFYDRLLPNLRRAWGVCFDAQRLLRVPREAHDVPVHRVLSARDVLA